ncbi:PD-(D/E)XK nuclease family protein [Methylorubrum populi]|uniref:PD-(D/E)XK endonuclease-like domain-containing protein n=1 Tax=Methylorubrum populi TaxID=223967 RepID=A0A833J4F2_9HYPH|nr:PD-(D/E)XK nuclease family protein [Methylorubrum populi]KAB7783924.1 hypothetical protein F8B43_3847 [Methylorubrum populi]
MKCPARYRHEVLEGLSALAEKSAYLRFHGCVRQVLVWMGDKACAGETATAREAVAYLDDVWRDRGPRGGFEAVYFAEARRMVSAAAALVDAGHRPVERVLSVVVASQTVVVRPDRVLEAPDGSIVIRRFRTGRRSKSEEEKPIWALLAAAGEAAFPGRVVHLQAFYPAAAEIVPIAPERDGTELAPYADALAGVARGEFAPVTSRDCPTCQFYFICTAEDSF